MDKTARSELQRVFVTDRLPDPLAPASLHLQLLDRFLVDTRLRLRRIRDPYEDKTFFILQQVTERADALDIVSAEIHLDSKEVGSFDRIEGRELRMNRYFHEFDRGMFELDAFLGPLNGLVLAKVEFQDQAEYANYIAPPFCIVDVTNNRFFAGKSLSQRDFAEVGNELERMRRR
jgi:CYTH domain-containing protein